MTEEIVVLTTGGTLDKIYFDANSEFEVGSPVVGQLLKQAEVRLPFRVIELLRKDSLDLTDADRQVIRDAVHAQSAGRIVITHGTDTMTTTAAAISDVKGKTVVLTGALSPARFSSSDAMFNLGMAFGAVQVLPAGVYIAMNGRIFDADRVRKDRERNAFVELPESNS